MSLLAGVAVRDISPRQPLFLFGYPHVPRTSTGIHDPLLATALFLSDGRTPLLLIGLDILFISQASADLCRSVISKECGVPAANILISATHTHSGPVTVKILACRADSVVPPPNPEYMEYFHAGIIKAGVEAVRSARAAELAVTSTKISGVGCNRLSPEGAFDPEVGLLVVASEGKLLAVDIIYGMHPTVLHEDSKLVSSDFPHYARQAVAEAFPGITPVYHTAPCGNLSPRYHVRGQTFDEAERLGRILGDAVVAALRGLKRENFSTEVPLGAVQGHAELVPNKFQKVRDARLALDKARATFERLKLEGTPHGPMRTAECVVFGCEEGVTLAEAQEEGLVAALQERYKRAEIQVFQIGNTFIIGFPGEVFVEYPIELKQAVACGAGGLPFRRAFVIGLANGELQGYIVTPEAAAAGGYEAAFSMFAPESGRRLVDTTLNLMRKALT